MSFREASVVLVACVLASGEVRAADTSSPRIGAEPSARAKNEPFLRSLPASEAEAARARLKSGEVTERDLLHRLLVEREPSYRAAVEAFARDGANAEEFQDLLSRARPGPLSQALAAHATFFAARAFLNRSELEAALAAFEKVRGELSRGTPWTDEATLDLAQCWLRRPEGDPAKKGLDRARARACLEALAPRSGGLAAYPECPEREREMAALLLSELEGPPADEWRSVERELEGVARAIRSQLSGKTPDGGGGDESGPEQRKRQEQLLAAADRLLDLVREKRRGSPLPIGAHRETAPRAGAPDEWGEMTPREREAALAFLKEKFPERYKALIEQYMKVVANEPGSKKRP